MCCVITDPDHKVVSISLIPGVDENRFAQAGYHVYFPVEGDWPRKGEYFKPDVEEATDQ